MRPGAAAGLAGYPDPQALAALAKAAGDPLRVVRVQAALALTRYPPDLLEEGARRVAEKAMAEYVQSMKYRPDDPRSHYNLANFYRERGDLSSAKLEYEIALRQWPGFIPALVNLSMVAARLGDTQEAERDLREALRYEPGSAAAHFNLGLCLADQGRIQEAEASLRAA